MKQTEFRFDKKNTNTVIAVIGYGSFGKLLTRILLKHTSARILIVTKKTHKLMHNRISFVSINTIQCADLIIPCVPISAFAQTIQTIAPIIHTSTVVMSICSVMETPTLLMKQFLPPSIQIISSHPMFGPDSYRINKGLRGLRMVLHNETALPSMFRSLTAFMTQLGIHIIDLTPKEHDKYMARSLGYSYLIGKISQRLNIRKTPIDTVDFELLLQHVDIVKHDSEELFMDMQTQNSFAPMIHQEFQTVVHKLLQEIELQGKDVTNKNTILVHREDIWMI